MINDASASPEGRLDALRSLIAGADLGEFTAESNNHIHTIYSFSPYTPSMACLRGRQAGLQVVGSVDHDSIAAASEMREAASILGMGAVSGFECRAKIHSLADEESGNAPFADRKLNNPDSVGVAYLTVQAIPASRRDAVEAFLAPIRTARLERTRAMAEGANRLLEAQSVAPLDFEHDVVARSQFARGGTITERHLLFAMATRLIDHFGRGQALMTGLASMGVVLTDRQAQVLGDQANPYLDYDLLGTMKSAYLAEFYLQPERLEFGGELPDAATVVEFARSIGAVACYAYLGDVDASPTGDKKAERFEDAYLDELINYLVTVGFPAITYMPPRNTPAQLARLSELCRSRGLLEVSGVDINQPRQEFGCPELSQPTFAHLNETTWALVAHEILGEDPRYGLLDPRNPLAGIPLAERVGRYGDFGRRLARGDTPDAMVREMENL